MRSTRSKSVIGALNAQLLAAQRCTASVARELQREVDKRKTVEAVAVKLAIVADELQTSVERYRQQIGSLTAVFRARRDGRIVECSGRFVHLLGAASSEQVLTLRVRDLFLDPAQWQEQAVALTPTVMVSSQELRWRRSDGAPLTVLASIRESDGLIEGIAIDITDRKRADEADRQETPLAPHQCPAEGGGCPPGTR